MSARPRYVRSVNDLLGPTAGRPLLLYGAGGRGARVLEEARGAGLHVSGFVDTFKSGEFQGLPVIRLDGLGRALSAPALAGARVVVVSAFHRRICQALAGQGQPAPLVLLDPDEDAPLVHVSVEEVVRALEERRHPLPAARSRPVDRVPSRTLRCPSLSTIYFRPSGLSLCCWLPDLVEVPAQAGPEERAEALRRLDDIRHRVAEALDRGECRYCAVCPESAPANSGPLPGRFTGLHLDVSTRCNLSCAYCTVKNIFQGVDYDFDALFDQALSEGHTERALQFDWGGAGEPTLHPGFEGRTGELLDRGAVGVVFSNALRYSEAVGRGLALGRLRVVCSLDAGTAKTYASVRGVDAFERVWANLRRYLADGAAGVMLKYIVTDANSSAGEVEAFASRCAAEGVRSVCLSRDFYRAEVSPEEVRALELLGARCREAGMSVALLGTAVPESLARSLAGGP